MSAPVGSRSGRRIPDHDSSSLTSEHVVVGLVNVVSMTFVVGPFPTRPAATAVPDDAG
ncbi:MULTISPECIES: hypothetical protein [Actinoalloteichus]|uniref:hypothetical protein n=1 Tax=Actinoalloteichus TaxID=65496 RepID=UPI0012F90B32|nr:MULTISPECIES: hypothetical protein [Actinoalloteichus]